MLFPKSFDFFSLFEAQVQELMNAVEVLKDLKENGNIKKEARRMKEIEHKADGIAHEILYMLNKTFITPIEREDIAQIAHDLDDIIDELERAINRMYIYHIDPIPSEIYQCIELIEKASVEVSEGIRALRDPKKREDIRKSCELINFIENEADDLTRHIISRLFEQEKNPITIIKLKEIYDALESVTDRCEDVANVMETIIVKNY
jgi:predicted phosphate transport protein (TIGR00153 family)